MSAGNPYYINTYQNKSIKYSIDSTFSSDTDLLVERLSSSEVSATSEGVSDTLQNRVRAWILSKKGDYADDPRKGGHIINLIGSNNIFNPSYISNIVSSITTAFNTDFAGDATLQYITFNADTNKATRVLELYMIITDIATGKTISMNETVEG